MGPWIFFVVLEAFLLEPAVLVLQKQRKAAAKHGGLPHDGALRAAPLGCCPSSTEETMSLFTSHAGKKGNIGRGCAGVVPVAV